MTRSLVALALLLTLAGCGGSGPQGAPVRSDTVDLPKSYRFDPEVIEVERGTTVTWTNHDDFPHNVHLLDGSDREEALPVGGSATITFEDPGRVAYECSLHPQQMQGTVIVN